MMKIWLLILVLTLAGCKSPSAEPMPNPNVADEDTDVDEGCQMIGTIIVNGQTKSFQYMDYHVGDEHEQEAIVNVTVNPNDNIVIQLPEHAVIYEWVLPEGCVPGALVKEHRTFVDEARAKNLEGMEGESANVQEFIFEVTDVDVFKTIKFYKNNIDESLNLPPALELTVNFACDFPKPSQSPIKRINDDWGIQMSVENATLNGLTLVIEQAGGQPTGDLQTGDPYLLEVKVDDEWIPLKIKQKDAAFHSVAYNIPKNSTTRFEVEWEWLYGTLTTTTEYRIGKEIMDFRETGDYDIRTYYAYFTL